LKTHKALSIIQVLPNLNGGGVEQGTLEIGNYLVENGNRSIVISGGGRMVEQLLNQGSEHIQANIGDKKLSTLKYIAWFKHQLIKIQPDIIHLRSRLPAWICYLAWKQLPKATRPHLVTTVHGQHSVNAYSNIMNIGEQVITVSHYMREHLIKNYPKIEKSAIRVIHRGVDNTVFYSSYQPSQQWKRLWYSQYPALKNKIIITLPGRLSKRKGATDFLDIIDKSRHVLPSIHGLIVGEPETDNNEYMAELRDLIKDKGLNNYITFTGHRNDLKDIMSSSAVIVSLSNKPEAFGRTVAEALSLGIPTLGYDHGGVSEQLRAIFPQGLTPLANTAKASAKLIDIIQNNINVTSEVPFSLNNMCDQTLSLYKSLANA